MGRSKGMSMAVAKHLGKKSSRKGGKRIPKKGSKAVRYGRRYSAAPPKKATSMRTIRPIEEAYGGERVETPMRGLVHFAAGNPQCG